MSIAINHVFFFKKLIQCMCSFSKELGLCAVFQMDYDDISFIIMQLSLTYYSLGVTISFWKFWFENATLITG